MPTGQPMTTRPGPAEPAAAPAVAAGWPRPHRPRLRARSLYRLQRLLAPNRAYQRLARLVESSPALSRVFTGAERQTKQAVFGCRMCGQCALPATGYACPMGCPKELRNGPCGGVRPDGGCEVHPELRCVWVQAFERAEAEGRAGDLRRLHRPADQSRWGQSSWVNYWQGRDEDLWTGDDGLTDPPTLLPLAPAAPGGRS